MLNDQQIASVLRAAKTIAVVGLSNKPWRPSFGVTEYMKRQGYEIIPVNPNIEETLGQEAWERLVDVPGKIDIVNIFRRSEFAGRIVDDAIRVRAGCVWLQEGVVDYAAAQRAEAAGMGVVMDRCILKEHARLLR